MADFDVVIESSPSEMTVEVGTTPSQFDVVIELGFLGPQGLPGETVLSYTSGQALSSFFVVRLNESLKAVYASCTEDISFSRVLGITQNSCGNNEIVNVRKYGLIIEPSWNWDMGKQIYLGEDGRLVQYTDIVGTKFVQVVGYPTSTTSMFVNILPPITIL